MGRKLAASALGAVMLAASSVGLIGSPSEAASTLLGPVETIEPDPANAAPYRHAYHRYRILFDALEPLYRPSPNQD